MLDIVFAFIGILLVCAFGALVGVVLGLPFALFNKVRGGRFGVGRWTRSILSLAGVVLVIWTIVARGPGYMNYAARAHASEGIALTYRFKTPLAEYFAQHQSFERVTMDQLISEKKQVTTEDSPPGYGLEEAGLMTMGKYVSAVSLLGAQSARIAVVATFSQGADKRIRGKEFRIATLDGGVTWFCGDLIPDAGLRGNNHIAETELPAACK